MTGRAVVFDLDGTLYRERRYALSGYAAVAAHVERTCGVPAAACFTRLAHALRRGRRYTAFQELCAELGAGPARVEEWVSVYRRHQPRLRLPRPTGVVLAALRRTWRLGVLTNGLPAVQRAKVRALGVEAFVDTVVYAEEHGAGTGKPDPQAFLEVIRRLGTAADRAVVVGDDAACDVAGGRLAGMRTIWLDRTWGRAACTSAGQADRVVASLREVPAALEAFGIPGEQHAL